MFILIKDGMVILLYVVVWAFWARDVVVTLWPEPISYGPLLLTRANGPLIFCTKTKKPPLINF